VLIAFSAFTSCSDNDNSIQEESGQNAKLFLTIKAGAVADTLAKGKDSQFSSLAIYIFNEDDGYCEYAELIPDFSQQSVSEYSRSVEVSPKTKIIYAIGNYNTTDKTMSLPLSPTTTMQELETLTVTNTQAFADSTIFMVGKQTVTINNPFVEAEVPMERLAARLDIFLFKNEKFRGDNITVNFVEFVNQVTNSKANYQNTEMISPVNRTRLMGSISGNTTLENMLSEGANISPDNARISFYSYQNIAASTTPDENITPYLRIGINIDGIDYVYRGYITDDGQTTNKYSLIRNTVYQVIAMLDHPDNALILKIIPLPWTVIESQTGGTVTDNDYVFDSWAFDVNAMLGVVFYPYQAGGVPHDETSYANYSFKLTAPAGKVWTATLTNGLDFKFGDQDASSGTIAVSRGIARDEEYMIKVGATKRWGGLQRKTYMYITVDGEKLKINPVLSTGYRKFPGDSDTDVLVVQNEYQ